jgi:glycolate oxidase FAD binding subunit
MNAPAPSSLAELVQCVQANARLIAVGAGTKPRLTEVGDSYTRVSMLQLRGVTEYEPAEYTVTALVGTPLLELVDTLAKKHQYLPFDPLLVRSGATLGGTVAAGLSGPGRFRFGGIRDFILGVRFVDGEGRLLRMGGKVVKNAAGFDLPKFLVGSIGRFGVLAEIPLKVFPQPATTLTLQLNASDLESALRTMAELGRSRFQPDALDLPPGGDSLCVRLAGPAEALSSMAQEILNRWPGALLSGSEAEALWKELSEANWATADNVLCKVALAPTQLPALTTALRTCAGRGHFSSGGNVAFISLPSDKCAELMNASLCSLGVAALTLRGTAPLWLGARRCPKISRAVKAALDPLGRFPALDE